MLFRSQNNKKKLKSICREIDLITPNAVEFEKLQIKKEEYACALLVKGGHSGGSTSTDSLFVNGKVIKHYSAPRLKNADKHGSGCVLSASLTANLGKGELLTDSISKSKKYISKFLTSNSTRSGYHKH